MHFSDKHIVAIGRVLLALFVLANTGFTIVMYRCTMDDISGGMSCCMEASSIPVHSGASTGSDQGSAASLAVKNASCMVKRVVGGLQADPKLAEKESTVPHLTKIDFVPVSFSAVPIGQNPDSPLSLISSVVPGVSPPSVKKYILVGSFLI